jgi:hypothetical protein
VLPADTFDKASLRGSISRRLCACVPLRIFARQARWQVPKETKYRVERDLIVSTET